MQSVVTGKGTRVVSALFFAFLVTLITGISIYARDAHAVTNSTINFQARILQSNGAVVADGSQSIQFKIYDAASGGTNEWTETQSLNTKNGYITASLGSVTSFPSTIDWSQEHWLTMNVNGDGEMGPNRMKITAVPYSFRSGQADALTNGSTTISASQLAQLAPGSIQGVSSSNTVLRVNQTGAGDLLQLQSSGTDKLTVANNGDTAIGGSLAVAGGVTVGNSTSTTAGTIRWTGTAFEGYNGTAWTSLGGGLVMSSGATASFVSGLANVAATTTGAAVKTLVFTSATGVSNKAGVTGFTAPAAGSFRTCLVKNNAAITGGTLNLRWRVNGVSVGSGACTMNATTNRQSSGSLDAGVVTFNAGDTIGVAFDTVGLAPAASNDFTVYWSVEYNSSSSSLTLQKVYDSSAAPVSVITADNKDISFTLSNTTNDSNFLVNIASGSTGKFAVQNNGTDTLKVDASGVTATSLSATTITGDGSALTNLNAGNVSSGTLSDSRLSANVTLQGNTFNGSNQLVLLDGTGKLPTLDGSALTNLSSANLTGALPALNGSALTSLSASNISSGTIADARLSTNVTLVGNTFNGNNQLVQLSGTGALPALDGSALTSLSAANLTGALPALNASSLTSLNGSNISSGTIADARLSTNVTLQGNTFNGNNQLVQLSGTGALPALNGSALTTLNGSNISSGTIADARLSSNVTLKGNTFNGASQLVLLDASSKLPAVDGSALTSLSAANLTGALPALDGSALVSLNGSNISSGTIADARLTTNVALLGTAQTFTARPTFSGGLVLGNTVTATNGALRWSGTDFEGYDGSTWQSLTINPSLYKQGGNSFGALAVIGTNDSNDLAFRTNSAEVGRFTTGGSLVVGGGATAPRNGELVDINGTLRSNKYILGTGPDLSLLPVAGGQSVLSSWWGLQLVGNKQSGVDYTPANIGAAGDFSVIIPNQQATKIGLVIRGQASQSGDLVQMQNSSGSTLSSFSAAGQLVLGNDLASPQAGTITFNDATGSNGFTSVLGTSTLTANRTLNLPDVSGTLLVLAPSAAQVDSGTSASIFINKTGASGNIITLQKGGTTAFSVLNSGALQLQLTNTAALTVNNAGGTQYFNVDTSAGLVQIGSSTADANATLLVLDTKNTTGDPTGTNGGMYYNSADKKNRCYENNAWIDCTTLSLAGETTLASANGTISVTLNGNYEYLECRADIVSRSTASLPYLRFNSDTGAAAYGWNAYGIVAAATTDWQDASDSEIQLTGTQTGTNIVSADMKITNISSSNKVVDWTAAGVEAVGTNSNRYSGVGGYYNTSSQITSVQIVASTGTFGAGSQLWCQGKNVR